MKTRAFALLALAGLGLVFGAAACRRSPAPATGTAEATALVYTCPMHPAYRSSHAGDCPMCGMRLEPVRTDGAAGGKGSAGAGGAPGAVRIGVDKQQLIGVRIDEVHSASASHLTLRVPGRVTVDEQRLYRITAAVDGWIRQLGNNPAGSFVRKNQVLATYYAQNLISAAQTFVFALQTNAQAQSGEATIGSQRGTTTLSLQVALDSLRALGMSELQIREIQEKRLAPTEVRVHAPITGYVIARNVLPEQRFDKGTEMYRVSDISHVWVMAEIFEKDGDFLTPGTRATVLYQGRRFEARMSDALPQFDPQTRTLKTRFELDNPGNILRPDMFVDVEVHVEMPAAVTVPAEAVLDSGLRKTVFVDRGDGYFEARRVETGRSVGDRVEIVRGLMAGDRIVASGNFLLDSESRMKAAAAGIYNPETDPVCGMEVDRDASRSANRTAAHGDSTYYFCSDDCKRKFAAEPGKYLEANRDHPPAAPAPARAPVAGARPGADTPRAGHGGMPGMPAVSKVVAAAAAPAAEPAQVKDLVCGMEIDRKDAAAAGRKVEHAGKSYYFCSDDCKKKFAAEPAKYLK